MSTKIILKRSSDVTSSGIPNIASLDYGELALNYGTGTLYFKRSDNTLGTISGGGGAGTVTGVTATSPVASSGGVAPVISLSDGYGDTKNPYASKTANHVLAAPNGSNGVPTFRALVASDIPTLNQNTTGSAASLSATLAVASGGTGVTTAQAAMNAFAGATTSGQYLRGDGTNVVMSSIQAADIPTLNQNTTGSAASLSATLAVASGGTGQTTYTDGQLLIGNSTGNTLTKATLTAGTGITITNGAGSITITATGSALILYRNTTDATPTVLSSNDSAAGANNQLILPNNSAYHFRIQIIAMQQAAGGTNAAGFTFTGVIRRGANAAATSLLASSKTIDYESDTNWDCNVSADTTNGGLAITCTGVAATNIRWVATCWTSEVTYA